MTDTPQWLQARAKVQRLSSSSLSNMAAEPFGRLRTALLVILALAAVLGRALPDGEGCRHEFDMETYEPNRTDSSCENKMGERDINLNFDKMLPWMVT